jgi:hypothetical protein
MTEKERSKEVQEIQVRVVPSGRLVSNRLYVNSFFIASSPLDFHLYCMDTVPITEFNKEEMLDESAGKIQSAIRAELVIHPAAMQGLIEMLKDNFERWKKTQEELAKKARR